MPKVRVQFSRTITVFRELNLPDDMPIDLTTLEDYIQDNQFNLDDEVVEELLQFNANANALPTEFISIPSHRVGTETCIEGITFEGQSNGPPDVNHFVSNENDLKEEI